MKREEAINLLGWLKSKTNRDDDLEAIDMAIEALSAVRCKDCRYYSPIDENKPYPCEVGIMVCNKDDYCSYGERKE